MTRIFGGAVAAAPRERSMLFVDGENFTIRGQRVASARGATLTEGPEWQKDRFLWVPYDGLAFIVNARREEPQASRLAFRTPELHAQPTRAYYYASVVGDDPARAKVGELLWDLGFEPKVFKKDATSEKTKAVDIALCTDILSHAFLHNYDTAVLVAGDQDYVPLVEELKHHGKVVIVAFFTGNESGLSPDLRQSSDMFIDLTVGFVKLWEQRARQPN